MKIIVNLACLLILTAFNTTAMANTAPKAYDLSRTVLQPLPLTIRLLGQDDDGDELTYRIVEQPTHGIVSLDKNILTYTANDNYLGKDTMTYVVSDGRASSAIKKIDITIIQ